MANLVPAYPSISLHGGQKHQDRIRKTVLATVSSEGITYESLFDALASETPQNSSWMVAHMTETGEIKVNEAGLVYA